MTRNHIVSSFVPVSSDGHAEAPGEMADFLDSEEDAEEEKGWKSLLLGVRDVLWRERDWIPWLAAHYVVPCERLVLVSTK